MFQSIICIILIIVAIPMVIICHAIQFFKK